MNVLEILKDPQTRAEFERLPPQDQVAFSWRANWLIKAHRHQVIPPGDWWSIWLLLGGRGSGKTRAAAEQIAYWAWKYPKSRGLVAAPTSSDVRATCFEGDSGLLEVIPAALIEDYNKALHELRLINGSLIKGIPASEPERFRGPQFSFGWCCVPGTLITMADGSEKPIEGVQVGDVVATRHGPRKVLAASVSRNPNDLAHIRLGQTSLTVTVDHPILVDDQWVPAGELKRGDLVWVTSTSAGATPTGLSTSSTSGQSLRDGLSITRTRTSQTTILQTWRQCLSRNISGFMQQAGLGLKSRLKQLGRLCGRFVSRSLQSAFNVMQSLSLRQQASQGSFALSHAWSAGGAIGLFRNPDPAKYVELDTQPSKSFSDIAASSVTTDRKYEPIVLTQQAVKSVERYPNSLTYNLTVEGEHEFIANGIVVHNCDELAAWDYIQEAWDQMQFGMRLKLPDMPTRLICTTTPKPKDLIIDLVSREGQDVAVTRASTYANIDNLSENFKRQILQYEGTKLGRQEIHAEIIDPEDGGIIKREWFKLWPAGREFPKFEYILQSYDCATSEKTQNDYTACVSYGVFKPQDGPMSVMVIDCWQDRLQYPDLRSKVIEDYDVIFGEGKDKKRVDAILIEDKSAGISLIQDLQRAHLPVASYNPGRADKMQRLNIVSHVIARGRVWVPESDSRRGYVKDWAEPFISQICSFPDSTFDDLVDAGVQGLRWLRDAGWLEVDPPPREDYDEEDYVDAHGEKVNPYAA